VSLVKMGHEVVFRPGEAYIRHLETGRVANVKEVNGVYEVEYDLEPYGAHRAPERPASV
jgi:hypothetical protein